MVCKKAREIYMYTYGTFFDNWFELAIHRIFISLTQQNMVMVSFFHTLTGFYLTRATKHGHDLFLPYTYRILSHSRNKTWS